MTDTISPSAVTDFWRAAGRPAWFRSDAERDKTIRTRFEATHLAASRREYEDWAATADGALALVLLFDQFPRHIYRGSPHAFATDPLAREVVDRAITDGFDLTFEASLQPFFYLPFEHHEDARSQARAVELFVGYAERSGDTDYLRFARMHADLIDRFGRFPHRNPLLGRTSTPEELEYLAGGGFKG
jgi:uncharacterized protein (DUF924 family)